MSTMQSWRSAKLVCFFILAALAAAARDASVHLEVPHQRTRPARDAFVRTPGNLLPSSAPVLDAAASSHGRKCWQMLYLGLTGQRKKACCRLRQFDSWCEPSRAITILHNVKSGREFIDHYEVLGVAAGAEASEIKRVFRDLSRKYHPDVNKDSNQEIYLRITAAYNILSDPERRTSFDTRRLSQVSSGAVGQDRLSNFEEALNHACNTFCNCDAPSTSPPPSNLNKNKMSRGAKTRTSIENRIYGMPSKYSGTDTKPQQQDTPTTMDTFDDAERIITPASTFQELSSFLAKAKRTSYLRPQIYTCSVCGSSSATRDKCDVCGALQSGPTNTAGANKQDRSRVFPIYSMHKFGSHLDDDRRHELVHKNHISRSAPAHTQPPNNRRMPENADIDTGVQRIWGQSEQVPPPPQQQQQRDGGRFAAGLDFLGVSPDANSLSFARAEVARSESESVWSGAGAVGLRGVGAVLAEGGAEYLSEVYSSAVSGGCWLLSDMEGPLAEVESERYQREREVVKSVMQKEAQVVELEGKVEQQRRALAELERTLAQARTELLEARTQQGWSGAGAVGMGGAGALFSTPSLFSANSISRLSTTPAYELSNVFSTISPTPKPSGYRQGSMPRSVLDGGPHVGQGWGGPGGVGMGGAGAVTQGSSDSSESKGGVGSGELCYVTYVSSGVGLAVVAAELSSILSSVSGVPGSSAVMAPGGASASASAEEFAGEFVRQNKGKVHEHKEREIGGKLSSGERVRSERSESESSAERVSVRARSTASMPTPSLNQSHEHCCKARGGAADGDGGARGPPQICSACGCYTHAGSIRCDCCGAAVAPPPPKAPEGKHAGLTKVFTMHKPGRTRLSDESMHTLVHPRHHSDQHPDPLSDAALQGRYKVDFDYFGIGILPAPPPSAARGVQEEEQAAGRDVRIDVSGDGGLRGSEEATAEEEAGMESQRFGTLEELNAYLRSQEPVGGAVGAVGAGEASCSGAPLRSELEVETPDVPWRVGGGLEESTEGPGLGAFNRLVAETRGWLGGGGDDDEDEQTEHDVPSTMFSEESSEESAEESEGDGPEAKQTRRRKAAGLVSAAIAADAASLLRPAAAEEAEEAEAESEATGLKGGDEAVMASVKGSAGSAGSADTSKASEPEGSYRPALAGAAGGEKGEEEESILGVIARRQEKAGKVDPGGGKEECGRQRREEEEREGREETERTRAREEEQEALQRGEEREEEKEERARLEDLSFFLSQIKAYAQRMRGEAARAAVLVTEMEGAFLPPPPERDIPPPAPSTRTLFLPPRLRLLRLPRLAQRL